MSMTSQEMAVKAVQTSSSDLAGRVVDQLTSYGLNYWQIFETVREWTGVELAEWDALLEDCD